MPTPSLQPKRGEIYWVKIPLKHSVGHEQRSPRRPWLIVSTSPLSRLGIVIGVPLSFRTHKANRLFRIAISDSQITRDTGSTLDPGERIALTEQLRCLAVERLEPDRQGTLSNTAISAVEAGVAFVLDIT